MPINRLSTTNELGIFIKPLNPTDIRKLSTLLDDKEFIRLRKQSNPTNLYETEMNDKRISNILKALPKPPLLSRQPTARDSIETRALIPNRNDSIPIGEDISKKEDAIMSGGILPDKEASVTLLKNDPVHELLKKIDAMKYTPYQSKPGAHMVPGSYDSMESSVHVKNEAIYKEGMGDDFVAIESEVSDSD